MKKLFYILCVLSFFNTFGQPPSLPITTANNLKISNPVIGTANDSVMVWRGTGDKILRFVPLTTLKNSFSGDFIKVDPTPDTQQTFVGDLLTRGSFESFAISGSKTRLSAQGIEFTLTGSAFKSFLTPNASFTANRQIAIPDKDGTIAIDADVIHKTTDETKNGNLQILKNSGEGTARLWVQSENGIASLRLQNGTNSAQGGAMYQDTSGNVAVQNGRPGAWLDLTVTELGGITSSAIKATPISQDVSAIELSGRVKIFDGVDNDEAASIGQVATKANNSDVIHDTGNESKIGDLKIVGFLSGVNTTTDQGIALDATTLDEANIQGVSADLSTARNFSLNRNGGNVGIGKKANNSFRLDIAGKTRTNDDIEIIDSAAGYIMTDTVTGTRYRLQVTSGVLTVTALP